MTQKIKGLIEKYFPLGLEIRHRLHQYPEPGMDEFKTSALVADTLTAHGIPVQRGIAKTGVVGLITGGKPGKTVLLRADMDALELEEKADVPWKSTRPGMMHACGHDGHTAGLVMTALALNDLKEELVGNVKLMFQPAEETIGGAEPMIREGVLENPRVDVAFGCHLWGNLKFGEIGIRPGPMMACPDEFKMRVNGRGGHAAQPHLTIDPIVIMTQIINAFQTIVSRRNNPLSPLVISICSIHGGEVFNVIPDYIDLIGSIRTLDQKQREGVHQEMEQIATGIASSLGGRCDFQVIKRYPPLVNDELATALVQEAATKIVGREKVKLAELTMGGEDFSYLTERVPAAFFFVGIAEDKPVLHHSPYFVWDDEALKVSAAVLCQAAVDYLMDDPTIWLYHPGDPPKTELRR